MILKWILGKLDVRIQIGLVCFRRGSSGRLLWTW